MLLNCENEWFCVGFIIFAGLMVGLGGGNKEMPWLVWVGKHRYSSWIEIRTPPPFGCWAEEKWPRTRKWDSCFSIWAEMICEPNSISSMIMRFTLDISKCLGYMRTERHFSREQKERRNDQGGHSLLLEPEDSCAGSAKFEPSSPN